MRIQRLSLSDDPDKGCLGSRFRAVRRRIEEQNQRLAAAELRLNICDVQRIGAGKRGVFRKLSLQPGVDLSNLVIDASEVTAFFFNFGSNRLVVCWL